MNLLPYENIFVAIIALLVSVLILYYLRIKHKERMEIIRLQQLNPEDDPDKKKYALLSKVVMALSLAVSLIAGQVLTICFPGQPALIMYLIAILFFTGLGLLIYYLILRKIE